MRFHYILIANAFQVLLRGCRCVEIDVWDGELPSSSEDESAECASGRKRDNLEKSIRKKLESRFGKRLSRHSKSNSIDVEPVSTSPSDTPSGIITPWRSRSIRAEPRVLHGTYLTSLFLLTWLSVLDLIRIHSYERNSFPISLRDNS